MAFSSSAQNDNDLTGDIFINAYNSGNYSPAQFQSPRKDDDLTAVNHSIVSSPEDTSDHAPDYDAAANGTGAPNSGEKLNPRSCVTCRKRKVRCDKREPCSNCVKASIDCHFPPPGRAPRKPRRPHDAELLKRLRRLESVVDSLGTQVDEDGNVHQVEPSERRGTADSTTLNDLSPTSQSRRTSLEFGLGRLLIKEGKSRYVSNEFWSSLGEEIAEIRNVLDDPSSGDEEDTTHPEREHEPVSKWAHHQGFVFGYSSLIFDMSKLHPNPSQIFILWEIFKESVDPVLKIVHVPTVKNVIMKAAVSSSSLSKASEALFYSICFASVVSMTDDQCQQLLGDEKDKLMQKYRFATEQGLSRASFLDSSDMMTLQALVMFLTCVKYIDNTRSIWALSGLAMYQAQAQGLHRDGSNFKIPPFDTEMRRRLWWHISLLDARAAEDHGADPRFNDHVYDTRMPLNVNDEDIWPEMTEAPHEQTGASDMTFCLVRFELAHMQRKLRMVAAIETTEDKKRTIKEKEHLIDASHQHMQEKYFAHCDPNSPFLWVAATVGKLILAKMWLFVHHPKIYAADSQAANELKDQVFITSIEVVEFGVLLERGRNTARWSWLFKTYMQWHAVAYVLAELIYRPLGAEYDRGWAVVDSVYERRMSELHNYQRGVLWRPLKQLYAKAKARRDQLNGQQPTMSPTSNPDTNSSSSNSDPNNVLTPPTGMTGDNWLGANPYMTPVSSIGQEFGLDYNNINAMNSYDFASIQNDISAMPMGEQMSMEEMPFGWTQDGGPYMTGFDMSDQQNMWQPQMQQDWH